MGNSLGGRKMAKVMKIDGETFKFKTPIRAGEIMKNHPEHVLIASEAVKHFGIRAKPLEPQQELKPRKLYFLIVLPKLPPEEQIRAPRRVRSGINMSAKDRLDSLVLSRRASSDLTIMKPPSLVLDDEDDDVEKEGSSSGGSKINNNSTSGNGAVRIRMRLPKAQVAKLVQESTTAKEVAERLVDLCIGLNSDNGVQDQSVAVNDYRDGNRDNLMLQQQQHGPWKPGLDSIKETFKSHDKKRVGFSTIEEKELIY